MTKTTNSASKAVAVADLHEGVVLARVEIAAPPERVFRAISSEEIATWWGSPELYRTTKATFDLRVGGAWKSEGVGADGHTFHVGGEILEVDAPRRLVHTWAPSWEPGPPSTVSYALEPLADGAATRITVRHSGFVDPRACGDHASGWERVLGWLVGYASPPAADVAGAKHFLCKLLPPRASFMADMTGDERAVMAAHGAYWRGKLAGGHAIVFGPVVDGTSGYGIGVVRVRDDEELAAFIAGDPAIQANIGMRYESLPMVAAIY